eukprot:2326330-Heterocapsa_arctica.AAC.1
MLDLELNVDEPVLADVFVADADTTTKVPLRCWTRVDAGCRAFRTSSAKRLPWSAVVARTAVDAIAD